MKKEVFLDQISKIDVGSIQDESLRSTLLLLFNGIELLQQENLELKKINQSLRDQINQLTLRTIIIYYNKLPYENCCNEITSN